MHRLIVLAAALALALAVVPGAAAQEAGDEYRDLQWGLDQIDAPQAWAESTGEGQVIAIVDSGVDLTHPDLAEKMVGGATFSGCASAANGCGDGDWDEGHPHGTHVAGIAAAITGNGIGIAGVAPDAELLSVKVLDDAGSGTMEEIAAGIRWAADNGADVINLSLGAMPGAQVLEITGVMTDAVDAVDYAVSQGAVVVVAAGNDTFPLCAVPGWSANAMCVTATDPAGLMSWYSNFGTDEAMNMVAAPGGAGTLSCTDDVISTVPEGSEDFCGQSEGTPGYDFYAGTSMAAPHVAGVAALLTAQGRSVHDVYEVLRSTARQPVLGVQGVYTPTHGWGIVDAAAAVAAPGASTGGSEEPVEDVRENRPNGKSGAACRGNGRRAC